MVYNEKLKREIPDGWEYLPLGQIESNIITGKTPPTERKDFFYGDIPFITIGDIRGNMHIVSTEQHLSKNGADHQKTKYISKGAICVSCIASPGLVGFATEQSQTNQQINSIECKNDFNRSYLYFSLIDYFKVAKAKTGNTFPNMNKGDFASIMLIKPKKEVLESFHNKSSAIMELVLVNSRQNQQLAELRDWLLPMLMNGQVSVETND